MIEPEPLQQIDRTYVRWRGRKLSYFSGCDYFRLSSHPKVERALISGLKDFGLSVAASRLTTGNHVLYEKLERRLTRFFNADAAVLVSSGYITNLIVAQALSGQFSHALIDDAAHPSLVDASRLLECPVLQFEHRCTTGLESAIRRCGPGAKVILLTDGMFSRDGSVAPLKEYQKLLPRDAEMLVDDAHGAGVLGRNGRGALEHSGANARGVIQTITLSKAFGAYGGAILGSRSLRAKVLARSRLFVGSTPLPLPIANAALQALTILETDQTLRSRLFQNALEVKDAIECAGVPIPETPGPVIALSPKQDSSVAGIKTALTRAGVYPPFIKYPGAPAAGYFRFVISSEHTRSQLDNLVSVLTRVALLMMPASSESRV